MDVAASEFCKEGNKYDLDFKNADSKSEDWVSTDQLCEMYHGFIKDAPVVSIEDGFDQVITKRFMNSFQRKFVWKRFVEFIKKEELFYGEIAEQVHRLIWLQVSFFN